MNRQAKALFAIGFPLLLLFPQPFLQAQSHQFIIDGDTKDWQGISAKSYTKESTNSGPVALKSMAATHDEEYLYLRLRLDKTLQMVGPNEFGAQFYLYLDTDLNANTGYSIGNMGAELGFNLTGQVAYRNVTPENEMKLDQAGIRILPTVTGNTYEFAIKLDDPARRADLMKGDSVQILFYEASGDAYLPEKGQTFHYSIASEGLPKPAPLQTAKQSQDHLRVMSFNILDNGLVETNQKPHIQSLIQAMKPDLLVLNECWDIPAQRAIDFMNNTLPGPQWHAVKKDEGNITLSRYPIKDEWQILPNARLTATLINLPGQYPNDLLLVNAHLPCCNKDEERQNQADALMSFIQEARSNGGKITLPEQTPIVVAGDMNLVGKRETLATLKTGDIVNTGDYGKCGKPDWDATNFESATARHTHTRMNYTWFSPESDWPAGKLDYIFFTNSVLNAHQSFTINTRTMSRHSLNQLDLDATTSSKASDHLPVVADFSLKSFSAQESPFHPKEGEIRVIHQNNKIKVYLKPHPDTAFLYNMSGKQVGQWSANRNDNAENPTFSTRAIPKGVYWLQIQTANQSKVKKVLILD